MGFSSSSGRSLLPIVGECDLPLARDGLGVRVSREGGVSRRTMGALVLATPPVLAAFFLPNQIQRLPVFVSLSLSSLRRSNAARYRSYPSLK